MSNSVNRTERHIITTNSIIYKISPKIKSELGKGGRFTVVSSGSTAAESAQMARSLSEEVDQMNLVVAQ